MADLVRLHAFLEPKNPDAARRAISAIRLGVRLLETHPEVGRPVEGMESEFRDWWIAFGKGGYVVRYRVDNRIAVVLAVRHGREAGF
ncbi:MAG: type II toxin-antitoxin system RelE/ParE family toxin [Acetobacteraceae bacterium]